MIVRLERVVPFPRDTVYAWWTDFREDDHEGRDSPASSRREIVRREGHEVRLRDRATRPAPVTLEEHVILDPPSGYAVRARYPGADAWYEYRFDPVPEGTRIVLRAEVHARHLGRILLPFVAAWVHRYAERDTDFHLRRMALDFTTRGSAPPRPR